MKNNRLFFNQNKKRLIALLLVSVMALVLFTACGKDESTDLSNEPVIYNLAATDSYTVSQTATNYVKLNVSYSTDDGQRYNGDIIVKLDPENAPITVENFQTLVGEGFYDGLIFHRVIENFMIQGGDPLGTGAGGSENEIIGEFSANGYDNTIDHKRGVISMARQGAQGEADKYYYNTASSQFFIVHVDYPYLNGNYAAFGEVVFGMGSVDGIAGVATDSYDKPLREAKIVSAVFVNYTEQAATEGETNAD